jgi:hypothetical protein
MIKEIISNQEIFIIKQFYDNHVSIINKDDYFALDVFIGYVDSNNILYCKPGPPNGIDLKFILPTEEVSLYESKFYFPRDCSNYLSSIYGRGWLIPDTNFSHNWQ